MRRKTLAVALGALGTLAMCAVVAGLGVGAVDVAAATAAAGGASKHEVVIEALQYRPGALKVKRGDTVTWVNRDPFPHSVTAKGAFDSGSIAAGGSWRFVPRRAGLYPYVCTLHSNMKGTLEVE